MPCLQEQVQGYSALSQQLAQEYNVHAAAVIGHVPSAPAGSNTPGTSSKAAAAAAAATSASSQPGFEVASEMSEEERRRFRRQAGKACFGANQPKRTARLVPSVGIA